MSTKIDVLVLGGAGVDTIVRVPQLPPRLADSHMVPAIETRAGQTGDCVAMGVHALGLRTHHLDLIGTDYEGDLVRALHKERGIALTDAVAPSGTKRAVNLVGPDGQRMSLYDATRSQDTDRLPPEVVKALAAASRHAHVAITHPCSFTLPLLREAGVEISTDLHDWDGIESYHEAFAYEADVVFLSAAALVNPEKTMRRIMERGRAHAVVATAGPAGAHLLVDDTLTHIAAIAPPGPAIDSNGAGDAFAAGYLYGRLTGKSPQESCLYGAVAGAYACTVAAPGAKAITRRELLAHPGVMK